MLAGLEKRDKNIHIFLTNYYNVYMDMSHSRKTEAAINTNGEALGQGSHCLTLARWISSSRADSDSTVYTKLCRIKSNSLQTVNQ